MSISQKGKKASLETRAKMSIAHMGNQYGANPTAETLEKMRAAKMGNQYALGHKHSPKTLAKISAAKLGNTYRRGTDYRANGRHCARVYESAWGPIWVEECGRVYNIHHRDGNRQNDDPENLIALTSSEHAMLENALRSGDWNLASEIDAAGASRRHPCVPAQWK